jgi:DNA or RNA helicases of superfamily II
MATGSGKTLILHLNYYQFLHYNKEPLDNILLVTPNEGLSEQHLAELAASGIPARRFDLNHGGLWRDSKHTVQVIEITKLVEEKRGGGVSVPVEAFEGRNLIFVDEGHKGSGGEAWRKYRDALGETGFTFEYSATFGQALSAARNDPLTAEYGKAIVFDYSYRYFYGDGYGKDFRSSTCRMRPTRPKPICSFWATCSLSMSSSACLMNKPRSCAHTIWKSRSGCSSAARSTLSIARTNRSAAMC